MRFEPFAYDHAARLIGERPWTVSRDAELLHKAHCAAIETYQLRSLIVGIDIYNVEAEACGCPVPEPEDDHSPTIGAPICNSIEDLLDVSYDPAGDGRLPMMIETGQALKASAPDVDVRLPLAGPFTLASHLFGLENLICELVIDPEAVGRALFHLADNQARYAKAAVQAGLRVTLFESSVTPPLLSPVLFADQVAPVLRLICDETAALCHQRPQVIIGGDTLSIQGAMLALEPSYLICPVETDQEEFMLGTMLHPELSVRVNMRPEVFQQETADAALAEAERVMALASRRRHHTTVGSILPIGSKPEIVQATRRMLAAN